MPDMSVREEKECKAIVDLPQLRIMREENQRVDVCREISDDRTNTCREADQSPAPKVNVPFGDYVNINARPGPRPEPGGRLMACVAMMKKAKAGRHPSIIMEPFGPANGTQRQGASAVP